MAVVFEQLEQRRMLSATSYSYTGNTQTFTVPDQPLPVWLLLGLREQRRRRL